MKLTEKDKANIAAALAHSQKDKIKEILEAFGDNFSFFNGEIVGKEEHERFSLVFVCKIEVRYYTKDKPGFLHMETYADLTGEQIKKEIETRLFPDIIFYLKRDKLEEITGNKEELPEGESKMKYKLFEERLKRIEKRIGIKNDHQVDVNPKNYMLNMKISECFGFEVPHYLIRRLESEGILYIHELIEKTEDDIHKIKGIGYKGLHHLVFALNSHGLQLK